MSDLQLPDTWTADHVRGWLLVLCSTGYSELPGLAPDVATSVAVQTMANRAGEYGREILKRGTVLALREWRYAAHGYETLTQLSQTAALIKATAAMPVLADVARREMAPRAGDRRWREALSVVVSCLTGFAPAPDLEGWLRGLFYEPTLEPSLTGLLFVGLCKCRPQAYPLYVDRFLLLREQVTDRFVHIGPAFLDAVPPVMLIEHFSGLNAGARQAFASLLQDVPDSELVFGWGDKGPQLSWERQPRKSVVVPSGRHSPIEPFIEGYERVASRAPKGNINIGLLESIRQTH